MGPLKPESGPAVVPAETWEWARRLRSEGIWRLFKAGRLALVIITHSLYTVFLLQPVEMDISHYVVIQKQQRKLVAPHIAKGDILLQGEAISSKRHLSLLIYQNNKRNSLD